MAVPPPTRVTHGPSAGDEVYTGNPNAWRVTQVAVDALHSQAAVDAVARAHDVTCDEAFVAAVGAALSRRAAGQVADGNPLLLSQAVQRYGDHSAAAAAAASARSAAQTERRVQERRERAQRTFGHRRATRELVNPVMSRVSAPCQARIEAMLWSDMPDRVLFGSDEERRLHTALIGLVGRRIFDCAMRAVRRRRVRRDAADNGRS